MDTKQVKQLQEEIIRVGREAYQRGLIVARGGNLSVRLNEEEFLMTAHTAALGFLKPGDVVTVDLKGQVVKGKGKPSTETKLHTTIYRDTEAGAVVHLHPPYTNVLAVRGVDLKPMTFESSLFLGPTTPMVSQDSPSVTKLDGVIEALNVSNIIILKEHGTVAVGENLWDAFFLTEILEEAALMSYLEKTLGLPAPEKEENKLPAENEEIVTYTVFSEEHIKKIVTLVNQDEEAQRLGKSTHLTVNYAIKLADTNQVYNFHFKEGEIVKVSNDEDADFILSGKRKQWIAVFNGLIDPFAATTQKKLRLQKGSIGDLSKWYPPFYRVFALWKYAPVE
jgi:L-fuculose-phosphate aldolase